MVDHFNVPNSPAKYLLKSYPDRTTINPKPTVLSDKSLTPSFIHSLSIFGNSKVSYQCQQIIIIQTDCNKPCILIAISVSVPCYLYIPLRTIKETCK